MVSKYIDQGVAELVPGVLFIDEVCFSYFVKFLFFPFFLFWTGLISLLGAHAGRRMFYLPEPGSGVAHLAHRRPRLEPWHDPHSRR